MHRNLFIHSPADGHLGFFFSFLRFYLFDRETAREGTHAWAVGEGEAGSLLSREPDVGIKLGTLRS